MRMSVDETGLDDAELVLVDGDNLLHAVRGGRDDAAVAWLLPRLVAWRPPQVRVIVALDGHPAPGEAGRGRVARGIEFQHAGGRSADDVLVDLLAAQPYASRARTIVVTRDRGLQARTHRAGGLTRSTDWLVRQLASPGGSGGPASAGRPTRIGRGGPPPKPSTDDPGPDDVAGPAWRPGRGATRKKGNPRRTAKRDGRR